MVGLLTRSAGNLVKDTPALSEELAVVLTALDTDPRKHGLTVSDIGRDAPRRGNPGHAAEVDRGGNVPGEPGPDAWSLSATPA